MSNSPSDILFLGKGKLHRLVGGSGLCRLFRMTVYGISRHGAKLIGWATLPVPLATLAVILRFVSRKTAKKVCSDDWCMLFALILYYGLYICNIMWALVGKAGFPQRDLSYEQIEDFLKVKGLPDV